MEVWEWLEPQYKDRFKPLPKKVSFFVKMVDMSKHRRLELGIGLYFITYGNGTIGYALDVCDN